MNSLKNNFDRNIHFVIMAGILALTVMNTKKIKESFDSAFSSEDKLIHQLIEDESKLVEYLTTGNESQNTTGLKTILKVK